MAIRKTFLLTLLSLLSLSLHADEVKEEHKPKVPALYGRAFNANYATWPREEWKPWSASSNLEFVKGVLRQRKNVQPVQLFHKMYDLFAYSTYIQEHASDMVCAIQSPQLFFNDLEIFCSNSGNRRKKDYLMKTVNRTSTICGHAALLALLAQATPDVQRLIRRQNAVKTLQDKELSQELEQLLTQVHVCEPLTLEFWGRPWFERQIKQRSLYQIPLFKGLNTFPFALSLADVWNKVLELGGQGWGVYLWYTTIAYGCYALYQGGTVGKDEKTSKEHNNVYGKGLSRDAADRVFHRAGNMSLPYDYLWEKVKSNRVRGVLALTTAFYWYYHHKRRVEDIQAEHLTDVALIDTIKQVAAVFESGHALYAYTQKYEALRNVDVLEPLRTFFENDIQKDSELRELDDLLRRSAKQDRKLLYCNKGVLYRTYMLLCKKKKKLSELMVGIGMFDALHATAKLLNEREGTDAPYCYASYRQEKARPALNLKGVWNPFVDPEDVVVNNIKLGAGAAQHMIITGPNTGGKSTIEKATTFSVLLEQTLGIAPAQSCSLTPFHYIDSCITISDNTADGDSLFKQEVKRTQSIMRKVEDLAPGQHAFVVFDEMFRGTTPLEGVSCAYATAYQLGQKKNCLSMIATHFLELTNLVDGPGSFANAKVGVAIMRGGDLKRLYKLEPGVTDQHIAFDVLEESGVSNETVAHARRVLEELKKK